MERRLTDEQARTIALRVQGFCPDRVDITYAPFDLPNGYVMVSFTYANGQQMIGGIAPDGVMST